MCVPPDGCYDFTIFDAWGDGICCEYGHGYYNVHYENELICTGGEFGLEDSCDRIGDECAPPPAACCVGPNPNNCVDDWYEDECIALGGTFYPGFTCEQVSCWQCPVEFCETAPCVCPSRDTCNSFDRCGLRQTPDHGYGIYLPQDGVWTFSLCGSSFDTVLYVGTHPCSQDIGFSDNDCGMQSELTVALPEGVYYVTVEGDDDCGEYALSVTHAEDCMPDCPPGGVPGNEPDCQDDYEDVTNGGCNGMLPVFSPITCGETVCGTSGTYLYGGNSYRDTDWFQFVLPEAATLTWESCAAFPSTIYILDANQGGCSNIVTVAEDDAPTDVPASCHATLGPGTYWLWIGPRHFSGVPCGSTYVATLTVDPDVRLCGDFDSDGDVDVDDFYFFLDAYGSCAGDAPYRAECDFDADGCVTLIDYQRWMECYRAF